MRRWFILLLMLVLPLQGMASAYSPLQSSADAGAMPCHDIQQHTDTAAGAAGSDDATPNDNAGSSSHLCCLHFFTGSGTKAVTSPSQKFSDVSAFVLPLVTLYIPDSPDRPPRG